MTKVTKKKKEKKRRKKKKVSRELNYLISLIFCWWKVNIRVSFIYFSLDLHVFVEQII